jgi:hypothetical protein
VKVGRFVYGVFLFLCIGASKGNRLTSSFSINLISPFSVGCYDDERNRDFSFPVHIQLFSRCTEYDKPDSILMRFDYSKY